MTNLRVAVIGLTGKMGIEIAKLAQLQPEIGVTVTCGIGKGTSGSVNVPCYTELKQLVPGTFDVMVDFSTPQLLPEIASFCAQLNCPLVSGTTGIGPNEVAALNTAAKKIPILWAANMSLGIAVMGEMLKALKSLQGYQFQLEELHHKHKVDRPSGTAIQLQSQLQEAVGGNLPEPISIRGGGIFGIHKIWAIGDEETLTIEHTAMNRRVFARGALRASLWLKGQPPGLYEMADMFFQSVTST